MTAPIANVGIIPADAIDTVRRHFLPDPPHRNDIADALAASQARGTPALDWTAAAVRWLELRGYGTGGSA